MLQNMKLLSWSNSETSEYHADVDYCLPNHYVYTHEIFLVSQVGKCLTWVSKVAPISHVPYMEPVPCIILLLSRSARYGQWHKDKEKGAGGAAAVKTVLLVIII